MKTKICSFTALTFCLVSCAQSNPDQPTLEQILYQGKNGYLSVETNEQNLEKLTFHLRFSYSRIQDNLTDLMSKKSWALETKDRPSFSFALDEMKMPLGPELIQTNPTTVVFDAVEAKAETTYQETDLDQKQNRVRTPSLNLGQNLSFRFQPSADSASFELCVLAPSMAIMARPNQEFAFFRSSNLSSPFSLDLSFAQYNYARSCADLVFNAPKYESEDWTMGSSTKTGFHMESSRGVLLSAAEEGFVLPFEVMTENYEAHIIEKLFNLKSSDAVSEEVKEPVQNGTWVLGHHKDLISKKMTVFSKLLTEVLLRESFPLSAEHLQNILGDQCRILRLSQSQLYDEKMETFCLSGRFALQMKFQNFAIDRKQPGSQCYQGYAWFREKTDSKGREKWWRDGCEVAVDFQILLPADLEDEKNALQTLLQLHMQGQNFPPQWNEEIENRRIPLLVFHRMLEVWEKENQRPLYRQDWDKHVPEILEDIDASYGLH